MNFANSFFSSLTLRFKPHIRPSEKCDHQFSIQNFCCHEDAADGWFVNLVSEVGHSCCVCGLLLFLAVYPAGSEGVETLPRVLRQYFHSVWTVHGKEQVCTVWTLKFTVFWSYKGDNTWHSVFAGNIRIPWRWWNTMFVVSVRRCQEALTYWPTLSSDDSGVIVSLFFPLAITIVSNL